MMPDDQEKPEQTPREMIAKLAAMSPEEFNQFMLWNFQRICNQPLPADRNIAGEGMK